MSVVGLVSQVLPEYYSVFWDRVYPKTKEDMVGRIVFNVLYNVPDISSKPYGLYLRKIQSLQDELNKELAVL